MRARAYKSYLLTILLLILTSNGMDSLTLGLSLQSIKTDLSLSDTQLGFLSGIAFALFYGTMGIPIGRWADRGNRVLIITLTTALWGVGVALCGWAGTFLQLVLIRIGVAVGEAGCVPPAHSLIADYFERAERPRAVAIYMLGWPLSVTIGNLLSGWLIQLYGWRMTFLILGAPGLALAALACFTLEEPRRASVSSVERAVRGLPSNQAASESAPAPSLSAVCALLWSNRTFKHLLLCFAVGNFFGWGIGQWLPAFFVRSYGLPIGRLGTLFALIWGIGGLVGTYCGGEWASRRAAGNERLQLRVIAIAYCTFGVITAGVYLSHNLYAAFGFLGCAAVGMYIVSGPLFATIQTLIPERMRAVSIALVYLFANLIGMGLGPLSVGALSDLLHPLFGEESLRYALLLLCPGFLWSAWHAWMASKSVAMDLPSVQVEAGRQVRAEGASDRYGRTALAEIGSKLS